MYRYEGARAPLFSAVPQHRPAMERLLTALADAASIPPPPGVGDFPWAPPGRDYLVIEFTGGVTVRH